MVQLLNSIYLGAATPSDYGKAAGVVELLPFDYYLGAAVPSHGKPTINVLLSGVSPLTLLNAVSLNYIKAFGKCEQDGTPTPAIPVDIIANNGAIKVKDDELPVGYKRLLDIYFDGDSYFETGKKLNGNDVVTLTLQADSSAGQNVFGAYSGTGGSAINLSLYVYASASSQSYFRSNKTLLRPTLGTGKRTISFGNGSTSGFRTDVTYDVEEFETTDTAQIGALPNSTSPKFAGYLFGNVTVGNRLKYIPCERVSDSAIGYYETVNGEFLENQGTGTLTTSGYDTSHLTEIYYDGTQEIVTVKGKNLFTTIGETKDKFLNASGVEQNGIYENYQFSYTDYLPVLPNTTYTFSVRQVFNTTLLNHRIHEYTENKTWIKQGANLMTQSGGTLGGVVSATFTTSATTKWLRINYVYNPTGENPQLELGSTATDYQPYMTPVTATCQPLLSVGTYKDVQNITNGAVTRNVGVVVLTGNETDWTLLNGAFRTVVADNMVRLNVLCNMFNCVDAAVSTTNMPDLTIKTNQSYHYIYLKYLAVDNVDDWKQWLKDQYNAGTPVIVVYPKETPTTETVTGQTLTITQGTNIVSAEGSVDDLELEVSYKAYAEVTVEEIEAVNTDENVEVTIS